MQEGGRGGPHKERGRKKMKRGTKAKGRARHCPRSRQDESRVQNQRWSRTVKSANTLGKYPKRLLKRFGEGPEQWRRKGTRFGGQ